MSHVHSSVPPQTFWCLICLSSPLPFPKFLSWIRLIFLFSWPCFDLLVRFLMSRLGRPLIDHWAVRGGDVWRRHVAKNGCFWCVWREPVAKKVGKSSSHFKLQKNTQPVRHPKVRRQKLIHKSPSRGFQKNALKRAPGARKYPVPEDLQDRKKINRRSGTLQGP